MADPRPPERSDIPTVRLDREKPYLRLLSSTIYVRDQDVSLRFFIDKLGFNHVCFKVEDIEAEVRRLRASGIELRNEIMEFHDRKLVFLLGPEGVTVELAQWMRN